MSKRQNRSQNSNLSQFGLLDLPDTLDDGDDNMSDGSDDMDLEAELAAITGGGGGGKRRNKPKPTVLPASNLDALIADSLKDIPSDEDVSGDEDDPDLLSELKELTIEDNDAVPTPPPRSSRPAPALPSSDNSMVNLLQERISNYGLAEKNAKENGESSRARRFSRGLKTLIDMLKQAKAGKSINMDDIPPVVSTGKQPSPSDAPTRPLRRAPSAPTEDPNPENPTATESPVSTPAPLPPEPVTPVSPEPVSPAASSDPSMDPEKQQGLQIILKRKEELKAAALAFKESNKPLALEYLKVVKQFDMVVDAYKSGQEMNLNELPTVEMIAAAFTSEGKAEEQTQQSTPDPVPKQNLDEATGLITASSVEEALRQRLAVYQEQESKAKEQGNASKARRMGRIVKQYEDALRMRAAGRPVPVDELPTPPGFAPIPGPTAAAPPPGAPPAPPPRPRAQPRQPVVTRADKQLAFLVQRQREFKEAAIHAKKNGNMAQAKEYLRSAKGFDSVIAAAQGGLAVDLNSLPLPPQAKRKLEDTFDVVTVDDCGPSADNDSEDILTRLHHQLKTQLKLCQTTRDHYKAMGNVAETNRFEHLAVTVKQDLDVVKLAKQLGREPPKFHYESRQFSVVQCNTDLNENDLELTIVRGIAYSVPNPKEVDTYVKFEFPYPQEAPVSDRTALVKDTNSPEYNASFPLLIGRGARACLRLFKRHGIKFEVYSRGGWFSRDTLLGSLTVKLAPLETATTVHEAFPLMDGRRPAGGSLEVKLRVRTPLLQQQFDNTTHRWLVIDN